MPKERIVVAGEATRQETCKGQLAPMIEQAREHLGVAAQDTVPLADTGYGAGADLHAAAVQAMRDRLLEPLTRAQWLERSTIIEPRFGQIKQHDGFRRWTVWGLEGVKTQWTLLCATLNLRVLYARWRAGRPPEPGHAAIQMLEQVKRPERTGLFCECAPKAWEHAMPAAA